MRFSRKAKAVPDGFGAWKAAAAASFCAMPGLDDDIGAAWKRGEAVKLSGESRLLVVVPALLSLAVAAAIVVIWRDWLAALILFGSATTFLGWPWNAWLVRREARRRATARRNSEAERPLT